MNVDCVGGVAVRSECVPIESFFGQGGWPKLVMRPVRSNSSQGYALAINPSQPIAKRLSPPSHSHAQHAAVHVGVVLT